MKFSDLLILSPIMGLLFQFCYKLHKLITYIFTGKSIKFGNFTCLPKSTVDFDKQVKFPNLIDCPVNDKVKNL